MENNEIMKAKKLQKVKTAENLLGWLLISPYVLIFAVFTLLPTVLGFVFSFMKYNPYATDGNTFYGFQNFINIFNPNNAISMQFWSSFKPMLLFCLVGVPCLMVIPLILAYFINMQPPGYKLFRALIYLPNVLSITVVGIIFSGLFQETNMD